MLVKFVKMKSSLVEARLDSNTNYEANASAAFCNKVCKYEKMLKILHLLAKAMQAKY